MKRFMLDLYDDDTPLGKTVYVEVAKNKSAMKSSVKRFCKAQGCDERIGTYDGLAFAVGPDTKDGKVDAAYIYLHEPLELYCVIHECEHALQYLCPELYLAIGTGDYAMIDNGRSGENDAAEQLAKLIGSLSCHVWEAAR